MVRTLMVLMLLVAGALACGGGSESDAARAAMTRSSVGGVSSTAGVPDHVGAAATRTAMDLEARRRMDATRLASSVERVDLERMGLVGSVGDRQAMAQAELQRTMDREQGESLSSGGWNAWWYRPGHGDFTKPEVYNVHVDRDLFPVSPDCSGQVLHPWLEDNGYLYYGLYESIAELRPEWRMTWEEFKVVSESRLAWEMLPESGLKMRVWLDFVVLDDEGRESFYVVGAVALGRRVEVPSLGGGVIECPSWSSFEKASVILVRLG